MRRLSLSTTAAACALLFAANTMAQQSVPQKKCINTMNFDAAALASLQGFENIACLRKANNAKLSGTAQDCLTADFNGKITRRKNKTITENTNLCATVPDFGYTGATTINLAGVDAKLDLMADVFGTNLDAAVIACATNRPGCMCQQLVLGKVEGLARAKLAIFRTCKRLALKQGATSSLALADCVGNAGTPGSIAADSNGVLQVRVDKLGMTITNKCDTPGVTAGAFPGVCTSMSGTALASCLDARVECRVCELINAVDDLTVDCDLFDDGTANASCEVPPTPTPTVAPSPTPTVDPALVFQGALTKSSGRFNYGAVLGLPGANAACNTNYPGSHVCTIAELQAAEGAGGLVGATDTTSLAVTSFWAIDSTHADTLQCHTTIAWDYQTAHTGHYGEKMTLNNVTGDLGPVTGGVGSECLQQHWVGCCI